MRKKTTAVKKAAGTYRERKTKTFPVDKVNDFDVIPYEIADNPGAVKVWQRYRSHFARVGVAAIDVPLLAAFCSELATYWACQAYLSEYGFTYDINNGTQAPRPEIKIGRDAFDRAARLAAKFGLMLLDRQKLDPSQAQEAFDEKRALLNKLMQNEHKNIF